MFVSSDHFQILALRLKPLYANNFFFQLQTPQRIEFFGVRLELGKIVVVFVRGGVGIALKKDDSASFVANSDIFSDRIEF